MRSTNQRNSDSWRTCIRSVTWGCLPSPPNDPSPISRPMITPRSKSERLLIDPSCSGSIGCFTVKKNVKPPEAGPRPHDRARHEQGHRMGPPPAPAPRVSVDERCHDEPPRGLLALAIGLDVVARLQVLVHDLALERAHRLEGHRAGVVPGPYRSLVGRRAERHRSALAVAGSVDNHALARVEALECDPVRE